MISTASQQILHRIETDGSVKAVFRKPFELDAVMIKVRECVPNAQEVTELAVDTGTYLRLFRESALRARRPARARLALGVIH